MDAWPTGPGNRRMSASHSRLAEFTTSPLPGGRHADFDLLLVARLMLDDGGMRRVGRLMKVAGHGRFDLEGAVGAGLNRPRADRQRPLPFAALLDLADPG